MVSGPVAGRGVYQTIPAESAHFANGAKSAAPSRFGLAFMNAVCGCACQSFDGLSHANTWATRHYSASLLYLEASSSCRSARHVAASHP